MKDTRRSIGASTATAHLEYGVAVLGQMAIMLLAEYLLPSLAVVCTIQFTARRAIELWCRINLTINLLVWHGTVSGKRAQGQPTEKKNSNTCTRVGSIFLYLLFAHIYIYINAMFLFEQFFCTQGNHKIESKATAMRVRAQQK